MLEMKFTWSALIIVLALLGAVVYYSDTDSGILRRNLRAALPLPAGVIEMTSLDDPSLVAVSEVNPDEMVDAPISSAIISAQPNVEGMITEEAAFDVVDNKSGQKKIDDVMAVPPTAQTGPGNLVWFVIGASLLTGILGLMIAPTVVARG